MFHIHTFDGIQHNIPLESLNKKKYVKKTGENAPSRKSLVDHSEGQTPGQKPVYDQAKKAYHDAIELKHDHEELLYAYMIMSSPVITIKPHIPVIEAWEYFQKCNVYHMPVINNSTIVGIVSDRDFLRQLIIENGNVINSTDKIIEDIMTKDVITASCVTDIRRIAKVLFDHHIGTMPIIDNNDKLMGIITRSDILYALIHYPSLKLWA